MAQTEHNCITAGKDKHGYKEKKTDMQITKMYDLGACHGQVLSATFFSFSYSFLIHFLLSTTKKLHIAKNTSSN